MMPRIQPIEKPTTLFQHLAFWQTRKLFGKVITPLRVIYARKPRLGFIAQMIGRTMESGLSLEPELCTLVSAHVSMLNRCDFCHDLALAQAVRLRVGEERFAALADYRHSPIFTDRERAALLFVEQATRDRAVSDDIFREVTAHFSELEVIELTWLNAAENYFNLQSGVLEIGSDGLAELQRAGAA